MRSSIVAFLGAEGLDGIATLVPTSSVIHAIAVLAVIALFLQRSTKAGLSLDQALPTAATAALGTILGGRLFFLLQDGRLLTAGTARLISVHGMGSWGACMGAAVVGAAYVWHRRLESWALLDAGASCVGLAIAAARLGCLLEGCDFGRVASVPWAIHYPAGSPAFGAHLARGLILPGASQSLGAHPLPAYLSLNALVLFAILSAMWRRTWCRPGITFAAAWILYGATRFFWEFLRDPAAGGAVTGISLSQKMALVSIGIGVAIALGISRQVTHRASRSANETAA